MISFYFSNFTNLEKSALFQQTDQKKKLKFWSIFCCNFQKNMLLLKNPRTLLECSGAFILIPSLPNLYGICLLILYNRQFSPFYYLFWSYDTTAVSRYAKRCSSTSCMPASFGLTIKSAQVIRINHINPVMSQILTDNCKALCIITFGCLSMSFCCQC